MGQCSIKGCNQKVYLINDSIAVNDNCCVIHTKFGKLDNNNKVIKPEERTKEEKDLVDIFVQDIKRYIGFKNIVYPCLNIPFPIQDIGIIRSFEKDIFCGDVSFNNTHFDSMGNFSEAKFYGNVFFIHTEFKSELIIKDAIFENNVNFSQSIFRDKVDLEQVVFKGNVNFTDSKFNKEVSIKKCVFDKELSFDLVNIANEFRLFECYVENISLHQAKINSSVYLEKINNSNIIEMFKKFNLILFRNLPHVITQSPQIDISEVIYQGNGKILFDRINVSRVSFWKTNLLIDKPRVDFKEVEFGKNNILWDDLSKKNSRTKDDSKEIERIYHQLRTIYETKGNYVDAGAFYVNEMKTRREALSNKTEKAVNWLYEIFSLYGESIFRPFIILILLLFVSTSALLLLGVKTNISPIKYSYPVSFSFSSLVDTLADVLYVFCLLLQSTFTGKSEMFYPLTRLGNILFTFVRVISLVLTTLLILAIRRRFHRKS